MTAVRTAWLDRAVPEAAVVGPCERAGWVRDRDVPRTVYGARVLRFAAPAGTEPAHITLAAYVHEGCQVVWLDGPLDARTGPVWDQIEALPRYEAHVEDAGAADPVRRVRGLRQWAAIAAHTGVRPPELDQALAAALADADPVVRACAEDLTQRR